jgi:hypothetical protein
MSSVGQLIGTFSVLSITEIVSVTLFTILIFRLGLGEMTCEVGALIAIRNYKLGCNKVNLFLGSTRSAFSASISNIFPVR